MKKRRLLLTILMLLTVALGMSASVNAQSSDSVYVSETGHWIWGEFLRAYNSVSDPLFYYGYPITDDFTDPVTRTRVQYFQKARFDLVDTVEGPQILMAPLGRLPRICSTTAFEISRLARFPKSALLAASTTCFFEAVPTGWSEKLNTLPERD